MLLTVVVIVVGAIVVLLAAASTKPDIFRIERKAIIKAPPAKILPFVEDFHRWATWSPYEHKDPNMQRSFGGAASGKGATYTWTGNRNVGEGNMEILDATPSKLTVALNFLKPMKANNTAEFTFVAQGDTTEVTWAMYGPTPFIGKIMHTLISMDRMVGDDFAKGLANLKKTVEA